MSKPKVICIVLGGGRGTRLYPLTNTRSKPAVPLAGKYRLVDIPISNCLNSGLNKIMVLTQYNSASLNTHIKNTYNFDIFSKGFVDILAAEQNNEGDSWFQGTADAVRQVQKHLSIHDYDYVLVLSGDQLYQMDFQKFLDFHIENEGGISIATIPVNRQDATGFGILKSNNSSQITAFIEKPSDDILNDWKSEVSEDNKKEGKEFLASMGIYIFNREILNKILSENDGNDFGKELIPHSIHKHKTLSYQYSGYWTDIGTIRSFFEANMDLTRDLPQFNLFSPKTIYTRSRMLPPSKIIGTRLNNVVFGDGCIVMAELIENSIIGVRSRIGFGSTIKNTYMMGADSFYMNSAEAEERRNNGSPIMGVGENCSIENAILDKNCFIGNNVIIKGGAHLEDGNYDEYTVSDGIVIVKKYAELNDNFTIGV